jgi:hypothetical protein
MKLRTMAMMGLGATAAYYFDPQRGRGRRRGLGDAVSKMRGSPSGELRAALGPSSEVRGESGFVVIAAGTE